MSLIDGIAGGERGDILFLQHGSDYGRIWFRDCTHGEEDAVLAHVRLARP